MPCTQPVFRRRRIGCVGPQAEHIRTYGSIRLPQPCSESAADIRDSPIIRVRRSDNRIEVLLERRQRRAQAAPAVPRTFALGGAALGLQANLTIFSKLIPFKVGRS